MEYDGGLPPTRAGDLALGDVLGRMNRDRARGDDRPRLGAEYWHGRRLDSAALPG